MILASGFEVPTDCLAEICSRCGVHDETVVVSEGRPQPIGAGCQRTIGIARPNCAPGPFQPTRNGRQMPPDQIDHANPGHRADIGKQRRYRAAWKENNPLQVLADNKVRRRKHRDATPPWLSRKQKSEIRQLYQIAMTMTQTTGEQYVVDHIIPLRSDEVCGLHVPWNLRVVTREENLRKSNKLLAPPKIL